MTSIREHHLMKCIYPLNTYCLQSARPWVQAEGLLEARLLAMSVSRINSPNPSTTPGMKDPLSLIYREKERCEIPQLMRARGAAPESTLLPLKAATIVLASYCCCDILPQT